MDFYKKFRRFYIELTSISNGRSIYDSLLLHFIKNENTFIEKQKSFAISMTLIDMKDIYRTAILFRHLKS